MEARAGNSILDFETLFSDFQELLNGSGLTPVAGLIFETKNRAIFLERFSGEKLLPENSFLGQ